MALLDPGAARAALTEIGRRIWVKGFAAANDGNLSVRLGPGRFLTTATGSIKGFLAPEDLVVIDDAGRLVEGERNPSSEIRMHLAVYEERPDIDAVVHAHPPTATGFATAGVDLDACVLPEIVATLGRVPTVPYGTPATPELADAVRPVVRSGHACLLANHGAVAYDVDPFAAYYHLERLEHYARILLTARLLGNVQVMTGDQVGRLLAATGGDPTAAPCAVGTPGGAPPDVHSTAGTPGHGTPDHGTHGSSDLTGAGNGAPAIDDDLIELITREVRSALREEG